MATPRPQVPARRLSAEEVETWTERLLLQMTLEEKVSQMHGSGNDPDAGRWCTPAVERLSIPGFRMVDGPRGVSAGTGTATSFPVPMARGAAFDVELEAQVGEAIARESVGRGANVLLAPCINVLRHPRWGRAQETYGEHPLHLGLIGAAFVQGAQRHTLACVKHLAANSIEDTRFVVDVQMDGAALDRVYLPHFEHVVRQGVGAVMSAYNRLNGTYCDMHRALLTDTLKQRWGFDGMVMSDWMFGTHDTVESAHAGLDLEMPAARQFGAPLVQAVREGRVAESVVDEAARRVLRSKLRHGLFESPPQPDTSVIECPAHRQLAHLAALRGCVLLRNERQALPLTVDAARVAVLGPLADEPNLGDRGSSASRSSEVVTLLDGLVTHSGARHVQSLSAREAEAAGSFDAAVVVVGLSALEEGESMLGAGDRTDMELPRSQVALIERVAAVQPRTVVVVIGGSAIVMERWLGKVPAILMAWYPGMQGGDAVAELLYGEVSPSGRLPVAFPRREQDLPPFDSASHTVEYDLWHGDRHLRRQGVAPRYGFGHGLSYAEFSYSDLQLRRDGDDLHIAVTVRHTAGMAADEVVQAYLCEASDATGVRTLCAFQRIALAPGEQQRVHLTVAGHWLAVLQLDFDGAIVLGVGPSAAEARLMAPLPPPDRGPH